MTAEVRNRTKKKSQAAAVWRRLKKNKMAVLGLIILAIIVPCLLLGRLRNAAVPVVTIIGLQFGVLLGGQVVTETVFSWPGIGRLLVDCISLKDTPVVVACVLVLATMFTIINLCIDILYAFLDPRIRAQYKTAKR